jgi:hypothetical protein
MGKPSKPEKPQVKLKLKVKGASPEAVKNAVKKIVK